MLVSRTKVLVNRDRLGAFVLKFQRWIFSWSELAELLRERSSLIEVPLIKDVFIDQERKYGDRRRLDTVVVYTINYAN